MKYQVVRAGDRLPFGRLSFKVLAPQAVIEDIGHNNNSVVLRLDVGSVSFLFTGDAQHMEEQFMMDAGAPLKATILKVGHHGAASASSPAFLEAVDPEVAIYSRVRATCTASPNRKHWITCSRSARMCMGRILTAPSPCSPMARPTR